MKKETEWYITLGFFGAILLLIGYKLHKESLVGKVTQPDKQEKSTLNTFLGTERESHLWYPDADPGTSATVSLPIRYPARAGHEMTSMIEQGYVALFRPRKELVTWMTCPPSEEA